MKNIFYRILPACLLVVSCLAGCEDETKYLPLPKAVPLTMSINENAFVMGERLIVDLVINPDADGNEAVANEDFDIYFTAKSGTDDMSDLFKEFHGIATFPKGERAIHIDFPVKESGLSGSQSFDFVAFTRGYVIESSSQTIKVSDYYRVTMSLENNTESVVTEGDKFVLVANLDKPRAVPIVITITPKEGDEDAFENLPSTLTIAAGNTSVKSSAVSLTMDGVKTGDKPLTLNLESASPANPMKNDQIVITMTDLESLADPDLYDPTKVYANPESLFMSTKNKSAIEAWWTSGEKTHVVIGDSHPNAEIAAKGWKFKNAVEFHFVPNSFPGGWNAIPAPNGFGHRIPWGFSDINVKPMQTLQAVNNAKCTNLTDAGILRMWAQKGPVPTTGLSPNVDKDYGTFAYQGAKGGGNSSTRFVRINPGMRVEVSARITGVRTGFVPVIAIKNLAEGYATSPQEIDLLRNSKGNVVTQSVFSTVEEASKNNVIPQLGRWNIYWMELIDANTIHVGINGVTTLEVKKSAGANWSFDNGLEGLALLMYFAPSKDRPAEWDSVLKSISDPEKDERTPLMEVDWVRFYTNDNYSDLGQYWVNAAGVFFY